VASCKVRVSRALYLPFARYFGLGTVVLVLGDSVHLVYIMLRALPSARIAFGTLLLQAYRPLQQIIRQCRPTGEDYVTFWSVGRRVDGMQRRASVTPRDSSNTDAIVQTS